MKRSKLLVISLAISIITLLAILLLTISEETIKSLLAIKPQYLIIALLVQPISWVIWGARIKLMSDALGSRISLIESTRIVVANLFAAAITPSQAGGEPIRVHLLNKNGLSVGDSTAVVLGERVMDALFLMVATPIALFMFTNILRGNIILSSIFIGAGILFFVLIGLVVYGMMRPEQLKKIIELIVGGSTRLFGRFTVTRKIINRIHTEVDNFHDSLWHLIKKERRALFWGLVCTVGFWLMVYTIPSWILLGFGADPIIAQSIAAQVIITVIIMVPTTPGSSGVAEVSIASLYAVLIPSSILGVFILIFRFATYYLNLIIGGLYNLKMLKEAV